MTLDVPHRIIETNAGRDPRRLALKYRKMRASPFAFLRGTCALFHERLPVRDLPPSPAAWACGDLHLENFGSYKGDNRLVYFDLNDFDESALAPATWDLARFLASVLAAASGLSLPKHEALSLCTDVLDRYAAALASGKARWIERETASGGVRALLDPLRTRRRPEFLDKRTVIKGRRRLLRIDGTKALETTSGQRERVVEFMAQFARTAPDPAFFEVLDVADRIAGTGSLGMERYVILVRGEASPDGNYLLDLKRTGPSALVPHLSIAQPAWTSEAVRVATLQQRMQAIPMAFLHAVAIGGADYVLRELQPGEDRVELDRARDSLDHVRGVLGTMGELAAWAQLRASGRQGSATADELVAFGSATHWRTKLVDVARACAAQVESDWTTFSAAFDDGVFATA